MNKLELLAPAKDVECGKAAIDCGADALYIGAARFGAREAAGNTVDDIVELINYAHKYWARVYVTVNTLLYDNEIPQAVELIWDLYKAGADGVIIQDTGLLEYDLPPIPLIASTQMHNNTPDKVAFLEQVGIRRVILARELDLEQLREIRKHTNVELEYFVHGALCVCYSGQCYLSYALGGRSGNRGQCAQPCRKPYCLIDESGRTIVNSKHLLSLRDLNLSEDLRELIDAGVTSFKIEGRLKDKAYVSNVVAYYRRKLDEVISELRFAKSSSGMSRVEFTPDLNKTFNRGYTTYFLHGKREKKGSIDTPKMTGEPVGKVTDVAKRGVTVETSLKLNRGDGICFFDRKGELRGTVINEVHGKIIVPDKPEGIEKGTLIYRNHDHEFLNKVNKSRNERLIRVDLKLSDHLSGLTLKALDEDGNEAEYVHACAKALAEKPDRAVETIRKQLLKSGGTDFECVNLDIDLPEVYFLPISDLNSMRREVLGRLSEVRETNRPKEEGHILKNDVPYPQKELSYLGNVLNSKAEAFYRRHGVEKIEPAAESGLDMHGRKVMTTRYCLKHQLGECQGRGDRVQGTGKSPGSTLSLVDAEGDVLLLKFDCARCEMQVYHVE